MGELPGRPVVKVRFHAILPFARLESGIETMKWECQNQYQKALSAPIRSVWLF